MPVLRSRWARNEIHAVHLLACPASGGFRFREGVKRQVLVNCAPRLALGAAAAAPRPSQCIPSKYTAAGQARGVRTDNAVQETHFLSRRGREHSSSARVHMFSTAAAEMYWPYLIQDLAHSESTAPNAMARISSCSDSSAWRYTGKLCRSM